MLEIIINDVVRTVTGTFLRGDFVDLAIALGAVGAAALLMRRGTQIGSMTLLALVLFALGGFVRGLFTGAPAKAIEGGRMVSQLERSWSQFMSLQASALLAYFLAFMLLVFVVFALKTVVSRG